MDHRSSCFSTLADHAPDDSNLGRYGYMGGRGGQSLAGQMGYRHHASNRSNSSDAVVPGLDTEDTALVNGSEAPSGPTVHRHSGVCAGCGSGFFMNLLGFDRFTKGKAVDWLARASKHVVSLNAYGTD
ncbi:hypothetical protein H0H87_001804 [Tephrocybe sp. NHM501043]|nr:hypothetical protein H0H87_001804 [Tephrocybe sp. NHM501043]